MVTLSRSPSGVLTSIDNTERIRLAGVRPASPDELTQDWETLRDSGTTRLSSPAGNNKLASSFSMGKLFGDHVSIICRQDIEPSDAAMALLWKLGGSTSITMISNTQPAHTLKYIPADLSFRYTSKPVPACTQFLLEPSNMDCRQAALKAPHKGSIVLVGMDERIIARQTAMLSQLRPDVHVVACTCCLPDRSLRLSQGASGVDAFHRVANLWSGGSSFVARPLNRRDVSWLKQVTDYSFPAGTVIFAPFGAHGIDRSLFTRMSREFPERLTQCLQEAVKPSVELLPLELACPPTSQGNPGLKHLRQSIRRLGSSAVYGANGNIGSSIVEALGGKVPVTAISRHPDLLHLEKRASPRHSLVQARQLPEMTPVKTVFLTASVPWRRCPRTNKMIFDRSALLHDNLHNILIPQLRELPGTVKVLQIITNPCTELAFAAWLLRPDLQHATSAHAGTDIVRQHAHVSQPDNTDTWFTLGPHSPHQVNVDLAAARIDNQVPILGKSLSEEAGDRSVTDPTGLSSIVEAARLHSALPGCYALPLTREEAERMSEFLRAELGIRMTVSEGIAPTLPRDENRQIRFDLLRQAKSVPDFVDRTKTAFAEMETGRRQVLDSIVEWVAERHTQPQRVNRQWVLDNRDVILTL